MSRQGFLARRQADYRDALMASLLPAPGGDLPGIEDVELRAFWLEFEAAAPLHLRLGMRVACVILGLLPRVLGYWRALPELSADERESFIVRAASMRVISQLVELAKVVAGLAYFSDPEVQAAGRALGRDAQRQNGGQS